MIEALEESMEDKDEYIEEIKQKIDQMGYIQEKRIKNKMESQKKNMLKLKRLNQNELLFGGKVINAKVSNGKLLFRTGGGYIMFAEFLNLYAKDQVKELKEFASKEDINLEQAMREFELYYIEDFYSS
mmetsp:Transcript_23559/g.23218  ORF Transcript_23559/g.23218 Transcript_23559/m.23218 type:complete len:128 (+) Transcript_23559:1294-1677(+)